ncbi:MAG: hypothetical protein ACPGWR_15610 [Ardenticatenaceae bacterium]
MVRRDLPEENNVVITRPTRKWPKEALEHLPDGVRDSKALHILMFFKYDDPLTVEDFRGAINAHYSYREQHQLKDKDIEVFLISTIPLRRAVLNELGYQRTRRAGVYRSKDRLFALVPIIYPAELRSRRHNASLKIIVGPKNERLEAFDALKEDMLLSEEVKKELDELRAEAAGLDE